MDSFEVKLVADAFEVFVGDGILWRLSALTVGFVVSADIVEHLVDTISDSGGEPRDFSVGTMCGLGAGYEFHNSPFLSFLFVAETTVSDC